MKTIIIWDTCGEDQIRFLSAEGDHRNLDQVYINQSDSDETAQDELNDLVNKLTNHWQDRMPVSFPVAAFNPATDFVIVAGFLP